MEGRGVDPNLRTGPGEAVPGNGKVLGLIESWLGPGAFTVVLYAGPRLG